MVTLTCSHCGMKLNVKEEFAGRNTTCLGCKEPMVVPARETAQTVAPEAKARILFSCTKCGMKFNALAEFAGRKTTCPTCKEALVVPSPDQTVAYVPPAGQIDGPASSLAKAQVDAGVVLGGGAAAGKSSLHDLMEGKSGNVARYAIQKELARGGMGAILSAIDCDIRREVAVKYLLDQSDNKNKIRFVEEAQITGQLEHPNIVPIHELGVDAQKRVFFTMKMVKGRSLAQILKMLRGKPAEAEQEYGSGRLLNIFVNVCNALAYAHSRGVVHRDLKPANIMVGDFGEVYVMDWGLAKVLDRTKSVETGPPVAIALATLAVPVGDGVPGFAAPTAPMAMPVETSPSSATGSVSFSAGTGKVFTIREPDADLTQAGAIMGTPVYMPPEQAAGQIDNIDERSDIYSMGAILYELLTLHPPIDKAGGFRPIVLRVTQGQIEPPQKKAPERARAGKIPVELAAVAMKALAKNKEDRYQTIKALRKDIELFLEGRAVSAKHDTIREMAVKLAKRNKGASIATAAALMVLVAVAGFFLKINYDARLRAEKNYQAYQDQVKDSVPAFLRAAKLALSERQFDDAIVQASLAAKSAPDNAEAPFLKAEALIAKKRYAEAAAELAECLKLDPNKTAARKLADLCRKAQTEQADSPEETNSLLAFADIFEQARDQGLADGVLGNLGLGKNAQEVRERLLKMYRKRIEAAWPGKGNNLTLSAAGYSLGGLGQIADLTPLRGMPLTSLHLDNNDQIRDLTPLKGMPLTLLSLYRCTEIRDLGPLKGMPLAALGLSGCWQVRDLGPLKGMPLTTLHLGQNATVAAAVQVQDLEPLRGMPLTYLSLNGTPVRDLAPLKGMKFTELTLSNCTQVQDLEPLKGMQLTSLNLQGCTQIKGLTPLKDMPLTSLSLLFCRELRNLEGLKGMPLTSLVLGGSPQVEDLTPLEGMKLAELNFNGFAKVRDLMPLKGMPLTALKLQGCTQIEDLTPLKGMRLTALDLSKFALVRNLEPLTGMPLTALILEDCSRVRGLEPLTGMPLTVLRLGNCSQVRDLEALKGMRLRTLYLNGTQVRNLEPLKGMSLQSLAIYATGVTDLRPLQGMELEEIFLAPKDITQGLDIVRGMKSMKRIGLSWEKALPPAEFWARYDKGEFKK